MSAQALAAPTRPTATGISAEALSGQIDQFLRRRLAERGGVNVPERDRVIARRDQAAPVPLDFVCEEDVRLAIQAGQKLLVTERAIITPAARDLGEQYHVFSVLPWRG